MESRENWLLLAAKELEPNFKEQGLEYPNFKLSCGLCGGKAVGVCFGSGCSEDKSRQIFIDPTISDSIRVLDVLIHELIHACLPESEKHGKIFKKHAEALGLVGKMTATSAGEELKEELQKLVEKIGEYPHSKLILLKKNKKESDELDPKKSIVNLHCPNCDFVAKTTRYCLENFPRLECPDCKVELLTKNER